MKKTRKQAAGADEGQAAPVKKGRARGMIWSGSISFGLVSIPVSVQSAEVRKDLGFSMLDKRDMGPIGYKKVNKATGEEVPANAIVKGWEYEKGRYVLVDDKDFKRASPEKTQRIDIIAFVDAGQISPTYFEKPYFLEPTAKSDKAYALLREAMRRAGKVGIANVVMKSKQYLCALLIQDDTLILEILRYPHELRDPGDLHIPDKDLSRLKVSEPELKMAERLVEDMSGKFEPEKYHDEYHDELLKFLENKAKSGAVEEGAPTPEKSALEPPSDIMALLKRSLEKGGHGTSAQRPHPLH